MGGFYGYGNGKVVSILQNTPSYRGTSLIRNCSPPQDHRRVLGIGLL